MLQSKRERWRWPAPILCTTSRVSLWFAISRPLLYSTLFYHIRLFDFIWNKTFLAFITHPIRERFTCFSFSAVIRRTHELKNHTISRDTSAWGQFDLRNRRHYTECFNFHQRALWKHRSDYIRDLPPSEDFPPWSSHNIWSSFWGAGHRKVIGFAG